MKLLRFWFTLFIFLFLIWPLAPVHSSVGLIAHNITRSTDGEGFTTANLDTTGANFCFVSMANYLGAGGDDTFTDSYTNVWIPLTTYTQGGTLKISTWYATQPVTVGATHTLTVSTVAMKAYPAIALRCYNGAVTVSVLDAQTGNTAGSTTSLPTGSLTISSSSNFAIASLALSAVTSATAIDSSFINLDTANGVSGQNVGLAVADKGTVTPLSGTESPSFTWMTSSAAAAAISSYKTSGGGGVTCKGAFTLLGVGGC